MIEQVLEKLKSGVEPSTVIKLLIDDHKKEAERLKAEYNAYTAESLDIQKKSFEDSSKVNNKLENDYRGEIVDQMVGYLFGNPIVYQFDEQKVDNYDVLSEMFEDFKTRNSIEDLDSETGKKMGACGVSYRLAYIDKEGHTRITDLDPWKVIVLHDGDDTPYGLYYYTVNKNGNTHTRVEWYDGVNTTYYISDGERYNEEKQQIHTFDFMPIIEFINNEEKQSDFHKVSTLIDAYNRLTSNAQDEIEEFRQAYMMFKGVGMDEEEIKRAKKLGGIEVDENGDVKFITKDINDTFQENQKKTLKGNIYRFSKRVDMSDESFSSGGAQSGESRKWKLLALENNAIMKERKFSKSLRYQFKVLASAWNKKGYKVDFLDIYWGFKRNLPIELMYEVEVLQKGKGLMSDKTLYELLSIIPDPDWEMEQMRIENEGKVSLEDDDDVKSTEEI